MKNYSLVILLWIICHSFANAYGNNNTSTKPQKIATLSTKKVEPTDDVRFSVMSDSNTILISNASPIKELRVYNCNGKLIKTSAYLSSSFLYNVSDLPAGKYAFNVQVADKVVTHIYKKD